MKQQFTAKHPWTILAAGAAIQVLTGIPAAWGVFQQPVMDEYGLSEQGAGYAFGILIAAFGVGCVLGGFLQDSRGPRCAALWGTALLCGGFFAAAMLPGGSAAGRLLMPMLSDKIGRRPTDLLLFAVSLGLSAGFAFAQGWWVIACYAGLTFCYSGLAAVLPALSTDLFGLPHAGVNYGFLALGQSVGSLAFPFAANLWGLEAGRHWLAVGGAAAGFAAMWVLKPAGQTPRRQDTGA